MFSFAIISCNGSTLGTAGITGAAGVELLETGVKGVCDFKRLEPPLTASSIWRWDSGVFGKFGLEVDPLIGTRGGIGIARGGI